MTVFVMRMRSHGQPKSDSTVASLVVGLMRWPTRNGLVSLLRVTCRCSIWNRAFSRLGSSSGPVLSAAEVPTVHGPLDRPDARTPTVRHEMPDPWLFRMCRALVLTHRHPKVIPHCLMPCTGGRLAEKRQPAPRAGIRGRLIPDTGSSFKFVTLRFTAS